MWDVFKPFTGAMAWLREKLSLPKKVEETIRQQAAQHAGTVAAAAQLDMVAEARAALEKAIADGTPFEAFQRALVETIKKRWADASSGRLDVITRTNVQAAYAAGRFAQMNEPDVLADRPYWLFDAVLDTRTTDTCTACNGTVLPAGHPWWDGHYPLLHFCCRSGVRNLDEASARARGITEIPPAVNAAPGFGALPGLMWKPNEADYPPDLWQAFTARR